ncbi:MAG TPA: hypothetical protein VEH76_00965 [Methylocystis sp.]|nr:hypothetical protein [Methylocystis sp.]
MWRLTVAALYAVALVVVGVAASHHGRAEGYSSRGSSVQAQCHEQGHDKDAPAQTRCCEACTLAAAPILNAAIAPSFLYRQEIKTRLGFATRLCADLDDCPADLRSRAPPFAA